jgi:nicotinamidase/pyrazinamidase
MENVNKKTNILVIIDPQKSFMDTVNNMGSLAVPGAHDDMVRLATYVRANPPDDIVVTLDSHAERHIAHPIWWVDQNGNNPDPFTLITVEDVLSGKWKASDPAMQEHSMDYVQKLEKQGKYELRIWPYHCIVGTEGHDVENTLLEALMDWELLTGKKVTYVRKGTNPKTEHYSVFQAEVIIENDPLSKLNTELIEQINSYDKVKFAGEASSHCLGGSILNYLENIPAKDRKKVSVLIDCTSPVPGYENASEILFNKLVELEVSIERASETKKLKM